MIVSRSAAAVGVLFTVLVGTSTFAVRAQVRSPAGATAEDCCSQGKCVGSPNCTACTNCSRCAWCKGGGTCGVCAPKQPAPPKPAEPATPPATPTPTPRAGASPFVATDVPAASEDGVAVYFSPKGRCTAAVVDQIASAKQSIRVLAYRLTSPQIDEALVAASKRGVAVTIVLDGAQQSDRTSDATYFVDQGLPVLIDHVHAIAHNKVIVVDDREVITGSFNFTKDAETLNAENLLLIQGKPAITKAYVEDFEKHVAHSIAYQH
jgi:phosphatidylserine/phosphatidylglycerophosphate/cardiolipin synthase-like enzyme